jgi:maleate isomerase
MLSDVEEASAHFGRFAVTRIAMNSSALTQFASNNVIKAAELLGHAKCQVIGWSGTSSSWLGFDSDVHLCDSIEAVTGAKACTSVLAINEILKLTSAKKIALVSPYTRDVQQAIITNYEAAGFQMVAERHLEIEDNYSFSEVSSIQLETMIREVAGAKPDAILIMCTNLRGASLVEKLEVELGIPIYDSVSTVVWKALKLSNIDTRRIQGWGRLFREVL